MESTYRTEEKVRLNLAFPGHLAARVTELSREAGQSVTEWVKNALSQVVEEVEKKKLEKELIAECQMFYQIDKDLAEEWKDTETNV